MICGEFHAAASCPDVLVIYGEIYRTRNNEIISYRDHSKDNIKLHIMFAYSDNFS
jgi:hypothetical protein